MNVISEYSTIDSTILVKVFSHEILMFKIPNETPPDTWCSICWKLLWRRGGHIALIIISSFVPFKIFLTLRQFFFVWVISNFQVAALAQDLLESVQWSDAIEAADSPRIFPVGKTYLSIQFCCESWNTIWNQSGIYPTCSGQGLGRYGRLHCALQRILYGIIMTHIT